MAQELELEIDNNGVRPVRKNVIKGEMGWSWKRIFREEFRLKKFGFGDVYPGRFYMWQWRVPPLVFLLYRFAMAGYITGWMFYLTTLQASRPQPPQFHAVTWAAFLTNWTYVSLSIYFFLSLLVTLIHYCCVRRQGTKFLQRPPSDGHQNLYPETYSEPWGAQSGEYDPVPDVDMEMEFRLHKLPWYLKIIWILFNVVSSSSLMVTLVFFAFLFPQMKNDTAASNENVQLHMLNSVAIFIENLLCGVPVRLLHVIYPVSYGLIYMLFSLFYWIPDHERVMYPNVLDWNHAGHTVLMILIVGFVVIPVLHFLFFILYRLKLAIYKRCG